jgi:hypothetical protein
MKNEVRPDLNSTLITQLCEVLGLNNVGVNHANVKEESVTSKRGLSNRITAYI